MQPGVKQEPPTAEQCIANRHGFQFLRQGLRQQDNFIGQIIKGRRSITADTDLRLCRFFSLSDGYWLRAQATYALNHVGLEGVIGLLRKP